MGRIHIEEHKGQRIAVGDFRNCNPAELVDGIEEMMDTVTAQPHSSIHTLSDFSGAQFDRESITRLKEAAAFDRPHIIRAAFIGVDTLPEVYHKAIENFSARHFATFDTKEEAIKYLTQASVEEQSA